MHVPADAPGDGAEHGTPDMPATDPAYRPLSRAFFTRPVLTVAPDLLGRFLCSDSPEGRVVARLTEVEAYDGPNDPGSHAYRGRTPRNAVMFGPAGHAYVYFSYGMHWCSNVVCGPPGTASAVLLRAGEILEGHDLARRRRPAARTDRDLARGPARLAQALGIDDDNDGRDVVALASPLRVLTGVAVPTGDVRQGPRVGVGGAGAGTPWRFWVDGEATVSPYRAHVPRRRAAAVAQGGALLRVREDEGRD